MPTDSYLRVNANGDGEGSWSNNADQEEIAQARTKSSNTPDKFAVWTENIKRAFQDIVIIDIGGKLQEDKEPLFEAADSFVVLSSDKDMIAPWKAFGESHGCRCLAIIESDLGEGHDDIVLRETGFLHARISGLERGKFLFDSIVIKSLADLLVSASGYRRSVFLDFSKVGECIGCALEWTTSEGVRVTHSHFESKHGPLIRDYLLGLGLKNHRCKIFGLKANWVAAIASIVLWKENEVFLFDDRTGMFRAIKPIKKVSAPYAAGRWIFEENEDSVMLSQNGYEAQSMTVFDDLTIPVINENKPLYLSGRFPMWVIASILISYSSPSKFLFQPGNHFYCVDAEDSFELGKVKDRDRLSRPGRGSE